MWAITATPATTTRNRCKLSASAKIKRAAIIIIAPFIPSKIKVAKAIFLPATLATFVAPIFPEPNSRTSFLTNVLVRSKPNGIAAIT